jgi:hypothetical protein
MPSRFSDDAGQNKKISWDVRVFPHGYMCSSAWCKEIDADCSPKGNRDVGGRGPGLPALLAPRLIVR